MWVKTKPIEEVWVCEASPGPPRWRVYVSGSVHGSAFFFFGNIRDDSMSRWGPVSVGTWGSKVSWLVQQCFDLPGGRRVPREVLSV